MRCDYVGCVNSHSFSTDAAETETNHYALTIPTVAMPPHAVVVDDSAFQRTVVSETIDDHVEIVGTAENGREAIKVFAETEPDLLTMDIMMPKLNGIEALSAIKERSPETTVVMVTSVSQKEKMREAAKAGADGYVTKPFEAEELTAELDDAVGGSITG